MQHRTHRRNTILGAIALAAVIPAAVLVAGAAPASAGVGVTTAYNTSPPLTWVDDDGAQYVVARVLTGIEPGTGTFEWVIGRSQPNGGPDPAWGTYTGSYYRTTNVGVRPLVLDPPAEGMTFSHLAVDDDGTLSAVWPTAACAQPAQTCSRWFTRHDATGALVADPVLIEGGSGPSSDLNDGSFLGRTPGGATAWLGPDGTERGFPDLGGAGIANAVVDHSGRLVVATSDHRIVRWPVGGPIDLDVSISSCAAGAGFRVGRSAADDAFATVCSPTTTDPLEVELHEADGTLRWANTPPSIQVEGRMSSTTDAIIDRDDQVWVGGTGPVPAYDESISRADFLQAFTADEVSAPTDWHDGTRQSFYEYGSNAYPDLRPVPGAGIAFVHQIDCCQHPLAGTAPSSYTYAGIVEAEAVEPPTCKVDAPTVSAVTRTSAHVAFAACPLAQPDPAHQASSYRVAVRSGGSTTTTDLPFPTWFQTVTLDPVLTPGVVSTLATTPVNRAGVGGAAATRTVQVLAPFPTVEAFVDRQIHDLLRSPDVVPRDAIVTTVANGSQDPSDLIDGWLSDSRSRSVYDVQPIARLYEAFFLRPADASGLQYWVNRRNGGLKLAATASSFAASPEFVGRYGSLSNRGFVAQLYRNVFDRAPDPSGLAYWTSKLDRKILKRGAVVTQFSESSENLRRTKRLTAPLAAKFLMTGQSTSPAERADWAAAPDPQRAAIVSILGSQGYDDTVAGGSSHRAGDGGDL